MVARDEFDREILVDIPSPFDGAVIQPLRTLIERRMSILSGSIRQKPRWWEKVGDAEIVARWRTEMREQDGALVEKLWGGRERWYYTHPRPRFEEGEEEYDDEEDPEEFEERVYPKDGYRWGPAKQWPRDPISDAQLDYLFDELRYDATRVDRARGIYPGPIRCIYESRDAVSKDLKAELLQGVVALENVPEEEKDWHPGSNNQVLDLIHPSLYPLRIGHSMVSGENSSLEPITWKAYSDKRDDLAGIWSQDFASKDFQWLPTDFKIADASDSATPLSYINNLHPKKHPQLYRTVSSILARFVPLWEHVLSDAASDPPPSPFSFDPYKWYEGLPEQPDYRDEEAYDKWNREVRWPSIPEPTPFAPPPGDGRTEVKLGGRTLQVIVKLANIVLTPENPKYRGGSWHIEGMANERIVATGLYYYAMENITESRLGFRAVVGDDEAMSDFSYEQSDSKGYCTVYGFGGQDPLNQDLGSIRAEEDKCVAFPNMYQHRVDAFDLADPTRPGYRKILCFFLVDPFVRVLSTSDVPPQQEDWALEDLRKVDGLKKLPQELKDITADFARVGTISRKQAEEVREKLMEERKAAVVTHNEQIFEVEFNMCEH